MRQTRTIRGAYADWTLTLTTEPVPDEEPIDVPKEVMSTVADCFNMAVNCYELGRDVDRLGRRLC